jgi:tetrahydromethanopterin S-methyltransferase subunit A
MGMKLSVMAAAVAVYAGVVDAKALAAYKDVAMIAAAVVGGVAMVFGSVVLILSSKYKKMIAGNFFDIDTYVKDPTPSISSKAKCVLLNHLNVGSRKIDQEAVALAQAPSPFVPGLQVTSKVGTREGSVPLKPGKNGAIVVGTIRMGFGHHRIAYAATSWGLASNKTTYFHDLLNIDSPESKLIKDMDALYSQGSRMATEFGGSVEKIWGSFTKGGDENALRVSYQLAEHLRPILLGLPTDTPIIATHCFVGLAAVALGFTKVINLVIDNHAQWFIVVPGAYNLVQGPSNYHNLLRMGVPADKLRIAGAWVAKDMVENIDADCNARIARAKARKPRRLLIPVGGAGAQKTFVTSFVSGLKGQLDAGKVELFLNAGDHEHMRVAFIGALDKIGYAYDVVDTMDKVRHTSPSLVPRHDHPPPTTHPVSPRPDRPPASVACATPRPPTYPPTHLPTYHLPTYPPTHHHPLTSSHPASDSPIHCTRLRSGERLCQQAAQGRLAVDARHALRVQGLLPRRRHHRRHLARLGLPLLQALRAGLLPRAQAHDPPRRRPRGLLGAACVRAGRRHSRAARGP